MVYKSKVIFALKEIEGKKKKKDKLINYKLWYILWGEKKQTKKISKIEQNTP